MMPYVSGSANWRIPQKPLHSGMVAFNPVISPLSVDMPDAVEVRIILMVDLRDDPPMSMRFIGADRGWPVKPYLYDRLAEKGRVALASRRAVRRKSTIWPFASIARQR